MNSRTVLPRLALVSLFVGSALLAAAAEGVFKNLPPERFAKAGLHKLTAAELAELEQVMREAADGQLAAAEQRAVAAEQKAREAESKAAAANVAEKKGPSWLRALITLQETGDQPEGADAIESRLVGDYDGWTGRTQFKLENGQIWQQAAAGERFDAKRAAPRVKIYPGMLGVYWLEVEGVRERVKVKPVKLR